MSDPAEIVDPAFEAIVVWSLFGTSAALIAVIGTRTLKDILNFDKEYLSVLKD